MMEPAFTFLFLCNEQPELQSLAFVFAFCLCGASTATAIESCGPRAAAAAGDFVAASRPLLQCLPPAALAAEAAALAVAAGSVLVQLAVAAASPAEVSGKPAATAELLAGAAAGPLAAALPWWHLTLLQAESRAGGIALAP